MFTATPFIKLAAILLIGFTSGRTTFVCCLCLLLGLMDAAQTVEKPENPRRTYWLPRLLALLQQFFTLRVWPFYTALLGVVLLGRMTVDGGGDRPSAQGLATSRGWPGSGGANILHQPSLGGLCACGKPVGHDGSAVQTTSGAKRPTATPVPSAAETAARLEKLKQRSMTRPGGPSTSQLPGIGPNAKPLPPGLKPNPNVPVPKVEARRGDSRWEDSIHKT